MSGMTPLCITRLCAADPTSRTEVYAGSSHVAVAAKTSSHGDVQVQVYLCERLGLFIYQYWWFR